MAQEIERGEIERGVSQDLAKQRAESLSDVSYSLSFNLQPSGPIQGGVAIGFDLKDKSEPVVIDFNAPRENIKSLNVNYRPSGFEYSNGHIIVSTENMELGENAVIINFTAQDASLNRNDKFLYTLLVPDRASSVFPCFDQPDLKAQYTLQLELPKHWEASANGPLERQTDVVAASSAGKTEKRKVLTYQKTKPISSYLFSFAAGEFQAVSRNVDGRQMTMLHRETDSDKVARNIDRIFETHALALDWLEDYTRIPYPFAKFDFVLIPSFQYGGMEHNGNIFYNADQLLLDQSATIDQKLNRASLIAHETAHMWFGNLVTMKWFNDVWLKEVFANFMAAKIVHPGFPSINHDLGFMMKHHPSAYGEDRSQGSYPIQQQLSNLKNAGTLYGRIIYQKAPVVMRQLETMIGETAMREGLQEYLSRFSYSNAVWDDLIDILDRKTDQDLRRWSADWVKEPGTPEVSAAIATNLERKNFLQVRQFRKTGSDSFWSQQVDVKVFSQGEVVFEKRVQIEGETTEVALPNEFPNYDFVLINSTELGYGYFELEDKSELYLLKNVQDIDDDVTRGAAWLALYESLIRKYAAGGDPAIIHLYVNALIEGIKSEREPLNRQNLLNQIETFYWNFLNLESRKLYGALIEISLLQLMDSDDPAITKDAKSAFYKTFIKIAESRSSKQRLFDIWKNQSGIPGVEFSESDYTTLSYELAVRMPDQAEQILNEQRVRILNEDRRNKFDFVAKALSSDQQKQDQFFFSLRNPKNRRPERWVLEALDYLHHPLRDQSSEKYLLPSLELLEEIQVTGDIFFPKRWLLSTFRGHRSRTAAQTVRSFLQERPEYPANLKNKILQATDLLLRMHPQ